MEKRSKKNIIVAMISIVVLMLLLIGLTYAYYRSNIIGNTTNSINAATKNLKLVYADGSPNINATNFEPSDNVYEKVFTVTNEGNGEVSYVIFLIDVINTFERTDDIKFTLECTTNGTLPCGTVSDETTFPSLKQRLSTATIEKGKTHTYTFKFTYRDSGTDQSVDMGKTLKAKIQIYDVLGDDNVEYTETLVYHIINNAKLNKNGTQFVNTPPTKVGQQVSSSNWSLGTEENVYLQENELFWIAMYSNSEEDLYDCWDKWSEGEVEELSECSNVKKYNGCNDDVKNKYIFYDLTEDTYYVEDCDNERPIVGKAKYEKVLSTEEDDYGTSYYFRGKVDDNFVNFAGMCWRIVRISGDGSIKLILEDSKQECADVTRFYNRNFGTGNFGYEEKNVDSDSSQEAIMSYLEPVTNKNNSMVKEFYDFQTLLSTKINEKYTGKTIDNMLKSGDWCLDDKAYTKSGTTYTPLENYNYESNMYYESYLRLSGANGYQPSFKCNGTILNEFADVEGVSTKSPMYVATITANEAVYAGTIMNGSKINYDYYLAIMPELDADPNGFRFWTLSAATFYDADNVFEVSDNGYLTFDQNDYALDSRFGFRPAISLKKNILFDSGDGTKTNPYEVK